MHKICFSVSLFHTSTCFEHHVLIIRRSKFYYTASGIIKTIGGRPVHLWTGRPPNGQQNIKRFRRSFRSHESVTITNNYRGLPLHLKVNADLIMGNVEVS